MSTPPTSPPHALGEHADDLNRLAADASPTLSALLHLQAEATRRLADDIDADQAHDQPDTTP